MYSESVNDVEQQLEYLRNRLIELEMKVENQRTNQIELAISSGWNNDDIKNVIGTTDEELNFFRG